MCTVAMEFKTDVDTASDLLDQFYEKRRLLIVLAPNVAHGDYKLQNLMVQVSQETVFNSARTVMCHW